MKRMKTWIKEKIGIEFSELLYYLFLILMFFAKGIGAYDGQALYRLLFWGSMLCAAGKIALTDYTKKEWLRVILLGIFSVVIERHSGEKGGLLCYAVVIGMKGIPLKRIMQIGASVYGGTMFVMATYYSIFLEKSGYIEEIRVGLGNTVRYSLGYPHPNTLMVTYLAFITMLIYCLGEKYNWKYALTLSVGMIYLYSYCMSYTGVITCSLMIVLPLYLIKIRRNKLSVIEYGIGATALPLSLGYSFLSPFFMPEDILLFLKEHLSTFYSRLMLAKQYLMKDNFSFLGTRVEEVTTGKYSLDNSFLYAFVFNGVLFFIVIISAYIYMMYRLIKEKRNLELIMTCIFLVEAIMEPLLFNTSFKNVTLFFLGSVIWNENKTSIMKEQEKERGTVDDDV